MLLLVGLGNPGARYARHRHNIGFMAADAIARAHGVGSWRNRFSSLVSEGRLDAERVLLQKPQAYMNLSGHAVADAARFYKIPLGDIVVCHDEIDLAPGKVRIKTGGGVAGHNGLRDIQRALGTPDYWRVRLGIGHPGHKDRVTGHVLGNFAKVDQPWLDRLLDAVADAAPLLAARKPEEFMTRVALLTQEEDGR
jgi:peptidyl-tRNA hydrolase, PTH1 family